MNRSFDIVFIGSGISSSFTLLHLLRRLKETQEPHPLKIGVLEKSNEFITGIPYGERSGSSVLLITDLKSFIPEPEKSLYISWLTANKERLLAEMSRSGGHKTQEWLKKHAAALDANHWEDLFIPRRFFGLYLTEKINELIEEHDKKGGVSVDFIQTEIVGLQKTNNHWEINSKDGTDFQGKRVVLGVGSLPTRRLWGAAPIEEQNGLMVVNDIYNQGLDYTVEAMRAFLKNQNSVNVAIIGANAGAVEILYRIIDAQLGEYCDSFYFVSSHGVLPDAYLDEEKLKSFAPVHLRDLANESVISASDIYDASQKDIDVAEAMALGARSSVGVISSAIGQLLGKLNHKELELFAARYGNEIGRRQRCAGSHYIDNIKALEDHGRFKHIAGRFQDLVESKDSEGYYLQIKDTNSGLFSSIEKPISLVINCTGSTDLQSEDTPELLRNILAKNLAKANDSGIGFEVNDKLQTQGGLFVVGPMLGGNVIQGKAVWHVEHCGRIVWLSGMLAEVLSSDI
ncbi:MAG: hypothetical protein RLZZ241_903 [Bacteroidota bacterium]|jgi:uncharacterized NAD(P)/FAD-binding protein YdhS